MSKSRKGGFFSEASPNTRRGDFFSEGRDVRGYESQKRAKEISLFQNPEYIYASIKDHLINKSPEEVDVFVNSQLGHLPEEDRQAIKDQYQEEFKREEVKAQAEAMVIEQEEAEKNIQKINEEIDKYAPKEGASIVEFSLFQENLDENGNISEEFKRFKEAQKIVEEKEKELYIGKVSNSVSNMSSTIKKNRELYNQSLRGGSPARVLERIEKAKANLALTPNPGYEKSWNPNSHIVKMFQDIGETEKEKKNKDINVLNNTFSAMDYLQKSDDFFNSFINNYEENSRIANESEEDKKDRLAYKYHLSKEQLRKAEEEWKNNYEIQLPSHIVSRGIPRAVSSLEESVNAIGDLGATLLSWVSSMAVEGVKHISGNRISKESFKELEEAREIVDSMAKPQAKKVIENILIGARGDIASINEYLEYDKNHPNYIDPESIPTDYLEYREWVKNLEIMAPETVVKFESDSTEREPRSKHLPGAGGWIKFKGTKEEYKALDPIRDILLRYDDVSRRYETYLEGDGLLSSLSNTAQGMVSEKLQIFNMLENSKNMGALKTARDKGEEMNPLELATAKSVLANINSKGVNTDFYFQVGQSVTQSAEMMGGQMINYTLLKRVPGLNKLFATLLSGALTPSAYGAAADAYVSQGQVVTNFETGEETVLASAQQKYDYIEKTKRLAFEVNEAINNNKVLEYEIYKIEEKLKDGQTLSEEEVSLLEDLETKKSLLTESQSFIDSLLDENGNLTMEEYGILRALLKGGTSMASEAFIERYGGAFLNKLGTRTRSLIIKPVLPKTKVGKVLSSAERLKTKVAVRLDKATDKFSVTRVPKKLVNKMYQSSGSDRIIHGIWEEFGEEGLQSLLPQIGEDYQSQLDEMMTADFWKTVALSTGITIGGMNVIQKSVVKGSEYMVSSDKREAIKKARTAKEKRKQALKEMFDNINDRKLDDNVLDIIASNSSTSASDAPYTRGVISDLRNLSKPFNDSNGNPLSNEVRLSQANSLETEMMTKAAFESMAVGESKKFESTMTRIIRDPNVDQHTRFAATEALRVSKRLQEIYSEESDKINIGTIRGLKIDKELYTSIENKNKNYKESFKTEFQKEIDDFNKSRRESGLPEFTFDEITELTEKEVHLMSKEELEDENTPARHIEFSEYYNSLSARDSGPSGATRNYELGRLLEASSRDAIFEIDKELSWEMSEENLPEIEKREKQRIKDELISTVTAENAEKIKKILKEKGLDTPENIVAINNKVINQDNNPGVEEKKTPVKENLPKNVITETEARERQAGGKIAKSKKVSEASKSLLEETEKEKKKGKTKQEEQQTKSSSEQQTQAEQQQSGIKIPNTEYEIKADGVYHEGKKLDNPENLSHKELIEADIKRRKQEELDEPKQYANYEVTGNPDKVNDHYFDENGFLMIGIKSSATSGSWSGVGNIIYTTESIEKIKDIEKQEGEEAALNYIKELLKTKEQARVNEINAKYDAELESLNNQTTSEVEKDSSESSTPEGNISQEAQDQINIAQSDDLLFAPIERNEESERQNNFVKVLTEELENFLRDHPRATFKGFLAGYSGDIGVVNAEQTFNLIAEAWENATGVKFEEEELEAVYNEFFYTPSYFGKSQKIASGVASVPPIEPTSAQTDNTVIPKPEEIEKTDSSMEKPSKVLDPSTGKVVDETFAVRQERQYADTAPKSGVLASTYIETEDGKQELTTDIREEAEPYMDYRNMKVGDEVEMIFDFESLLEDGATMEVWSNFEAQYLEEGSEKPSRKSVSVQERLTKLFKGVEGLNSWAEIRAELEKLNSITQLIAEGKATEEDIKDMQESILFQNEEFIKIVPVGLQNRGYTDKTDASGRPKKIIPGGMSDYYWFNNANVALKTGKQGDKTVLFTEERERRIQENRSINLAIRQDMLSSGSHKTTISENRDATNNKLLPKDKNKFNSVLSQFGNDVNEFHKHAAIAYLDNGDLIGEQGNDGKKKIVSINGVEINEQNTPNLRATKEGILNSGKNGKKVVSGRNILIVRTGTDSKGNPIFTAHNIITNHTQIQEKAEKSARMLSELSSLLSERLSDSKREKRAKKELREKFRKVFGYSLDHTDTQVLRGLFPFASSQVRADSSSIESIQKEIEEKEEALKTVKDFEESERIVREIQDLRGSLDSARVGNSFRQDFKPKYHRKGSKYNNIPNFENFETIEEFIEALERGDKKALVKNGIEEMLGNYHTNLVFNPITNNGETIYTNGSQPIIIYDTTPIIKKKVEEREKESKELVEKLESTLKTQEKLLEEASTPEEKRSLKNEISNTKKTLKQAKRQEEQIKLHKNILESFEDTDETFEEETNTIPEEDYGIAEIQDIMNRLLADTIGGLDISGEISLNDLYKKAELKYDEIISELRDRGKNREADFMEESRDEILGKHRKDGSIREYIELVLGVEEDTETLDDVGQVAKEVGKSSFELDARMGIRAKAKLMFFGIPDTRYGLGFAGFHSYLTPFEALEALQQILSEGVNNNSLEDVNNAIDARVKTNPMELGFFNDIKRKLNEINSVNPDIINELLYTLYTPPVNMVFSMHTVNDQGEVTIETYDANVRNPQIVKRNKWSEQVKLNGLLDLYGEGLFKLNPQKTQEAKDLHTKLTNKFESNGRSVDPSMRSDLIQYLNLFGIRLNGITLNNLFQKNSQNDIDLEGYLFGDRFAIINNLNDSLLYMESQEELGKELGFVNSSDKRGSVVKLNPITFKNSKLNDLIKADNSVEFIPSSSNYLGGKTVNSRQQPNSLTTKIGNIKDALYTYGRDLETNENAELPGELKALASMTMTSNSFLLERLKNSPIDMAKYFDHVLISLEAIIDKNSKARDDKSISELSDRDLLLTVFGQFMSSEGPVVDLDFTEEYGIELRKGIMAFPTIADSGQMPLLKTILLDLTAKDINIQEERISDGVLRLLADQLLYPDLLRMADFNLKIGKNSSNISGYDVGSQFITGMSSLQFLEVENKEGNLEMLPLAFSNFLKTEESVGEIESRGIDEALPDLVKEFIELNREAINDRINETLKQEADKIYEDFQNEELIDSRGRLNLSDGKVQNSYSRKDPRVAAYDFAINYALQYKEIQNIFAGDMAMYFSDKMGNGLKYGVPTIPMSELLEHFYPGESAMETVKEILDGISIEELTNPENKNDEVIMEIKEELFESFPELQYADELISSEVDAMKAYQAHLPLMKNKFNQIYKGVQNNLSKRLQGLISPGNKLANIKNQTDILQIMVSDMETISKTFMNLAESRYSEEVLNKLRPLVEEYHSLDEITHKNEIQKDRHKELGKEISKLVPSIAAYLKTAETDAQEYMSWREALVQLDGQGRLPSDIKESITRKMENQSRELAEGKEISEENKLSERELEYFSGQPSKPLYAGTITSDINGHLVNRFVYIKSSAFPLIPELTQLFPEFDKIRRNMEFLEETNPGKTVRISYQTANKVGAVKNSMSLEELHVPFSELDAVELEKKLSVVNNSSLILKREGHSIQQDVPSEYDKEERNTGTRATQFEKIILGDEISKITEKIFPAHSFDSELFSDLGIEVDKKSGNINGEDLKNIYREIYKREQKILSDRFLSELDASSFEDLENGKVSTMEAYADKINAKLTSKQDKEAIELLYQARNNQGVLVTLTKSELESSGLTAEKALFRFPVFMTPNSRKLESVMLSMVSKNNVNLTMPAFSSPVASERGFTYQGYNKADFEKARERGLIVSSNFDFEKGLTSTIREDGVRYAQVFVPNKFQVYNKETGRYELVDFTEYTNDGIIDLDKVPEELLSMFSFRIPTSSHQSGMVIEVAGILPSEMRDLMVVPKDSTIQIGEDFDIDKRYVYQYNLVKDEAGNLKKMEYSDVVKPEKSYREVKENFENEKNKLWDEYYRFDFPTYKARIRNPYFEANKHIIYELIWIEDALENYAADRIIARVFEDFSPGEDYNSMDRESLQQLKSDLEGKLIPHGTVKSKEKELREEYREIKEFLTDKFNEENSPLKESWETFNHYKNQKTNELRVLENNLVSMYKAVFSSTDPEVYNLITKVLSTDFAENSAEIIDDKLSQDEEFFNINSFHTQKKVMALGADGKAGIGKHSNSVTLHSIFQQSDTPLSLFRKSKEVAPDGTVKHFRRAYEIVLGDYVFDGQLGKIANEKSGTRISEYLMESQNSATDNQKLEIMGRRNENPETMGVFSLLQMNGIEDSTISYKGEDTNISYASMFISQPSIIEIAKIAKEKDPVSKNTKLPPINPKIQIESLLPAHVWMINKETNKPMVGVLNNKVKEEAGKFLTGQNLYEMIGKNFDEMSEAELIAQHYIISSYRSMKGAARQLSDIQSIINIENKGLGISMFDTIDLTNRLKRLSDINIVPFSELDTDMAETRGTFINEIIGETSNTQLDEDYIKVDDNFYIKPKTHFGHKIVNAVSLANGLIKPLFPYDSDLISQQVEHIARETGIDPGTEEYMELQYDIINSMKDYSFSNLRTLFPGGIEAHQKDLFFDDRSNNHKSLGSYILELREQSLTNPRIAKLLKLPLFRDMQIEVKDKTMPTIIKYNSDNLDKLSSAMSYNILKSLSKSDRSLPDRNGRKMTEASLIKEVFLYSLLADQANGAIGFRHLMPMELFTDSKVDAIMRVRNSDNNYMAHINYGGTVRTIENFLGSKMNNQGVIPSNPDSILTEEDLRALVINANKFVLATTGQEEAFSITNDMSVVYNYFNNESETSRTFVRQYFQHNPKKVENTVSSADIGSILKQNNYSFQDLVDGKTNEIIVKGSERIAKGDYFVIDMGYELRLYEKFHATSDNGSTGISGDNFHYRRIPLLGTFGFNEYNSGVNVNKSAVESNNFDNSWKSTPVITNPLKSSAVSLDNVMKNLLNDKQNPYNALVSVLSEFLPQIEGLSLEVREGINGKGQYDSKTKTITISKDIADSNNISEISAVIAEELLHAATTEIFGRYIRIEGIKENGTLDVVSVSEGDIPAPLMTLLSVYNQAFKHYSDKHGFEEVMNTIKEIKSRERKEVSSGLGMDAYRMSNVHEFIAGIFIKDKDFAREMSKTPYLSSGKNILQKFGEALSNLLHRLLPEASKDSYSAAVADSLLKLISLETSKNVPIRKSKVPNMKNKIDRLESLTNSVEEGPSVKDDAEIKEKLNNEDNDIPSPCDGGPSM